MTDYSDIVPSQMLATDDGRSKLIWRLLIEHRGEVRLDDRTLYGGDGTPADEWHRRSLAYRFPCPGVLDVERLRADLGQGGVLAELIDRIVAGHRVEWDGSNFSGTLTRDAEEASVELADRIDDHGTTVPYLADELELWPVEEWMSAGGSNDIDVQLDFAGLLPESDPKGEAVRDAAEGVMAAARHEGAVLLGDVEAYLGELIGQARKDAA
jgi:hypothetical protein